MWQKLRAHQSQFTDSLTDLFENNPNRANKFSTQAGPMYFDYSKTHMTSDTFQLLINLAKEKNVESKRDAMFRGEVINNTEGRAVMHTALRAGDNAPDEVKDELNKMESFVKAIFSGEWAGFSGQKITDVVNLGIGGSDLGPRFVVESLKKFHTGNVTCHFVANVDASDLIETLKPLNPKTTIFLVASKSFTTQETLMNAMSARQWLMQAAHDKAATAKHFVAMTANIEKAVDFGIDAENCYAMWDFVGGRYSLWSTIGLPIALAIGMDGFKQLLKGAHEMDIHFCEAPLDQNIPVIQALIGVWYRNFWNAQSYAVLPYDHYLTLLPNYLQQLEMESNGKSVLKNGKPAPHQTCGVIWGGVGTNGQHAFFQLMHQGTTLIPSDFILMRESEHHLPEHHRALYANAVAQMQALMEGKDLNTAKTELKSAGKSPEEIEFLAPHKVIAGDKPSCAIVLDKLTPKTLGMLVALYEQKVFVQSCIWDINAFDQWGVELGKQLAKPIFESLENETELSLDASTNALMKKFVK